MGKKPVHKFLCTKCQYIYDPRKGGGTAPPNSAFEYLPSDWVCPNCGASSAEFRKKYEVVEIETE